MTSNKPEDQAELLPKDYETLRDALIALRYMCAKRMAYPAVNANIEQRNDLLILSKAHFAANPREWLQLRDTSDGHTNLAWFLRVYTTIAKHFGLKPLIVEDEKAFPVFRKCFDLSNDCFNYSRVYDRRIIGLLVSTPRAKIYTHNGVDYGLQVNGQETEKEQSRERSRYAE